MRKFFVYIFFVSLLCCPLFLFSQEDDSIPDTLSFVEPSQTRNDDSVFNVLDKTEPVSVRKVSQQQIDSLLKEDDFWYANTAPKRKKTEPTESPAKGKPLLEKAWFRNLMWLIILCSFIAVVLWYLHSSNIILFRKAAKKLTEEQGGDSLTEDIFALNYDKEITNAVQAKNFRLAVRLWYLRILKELSNKNLIDYQYGRTNSDYVTQLNTTSYHRPFARLTRAFEYTWYGQFELPTDVYESIQTDFLAFQKSLR